MFSFNCFYAFKTKLLNDFKSWPNVRKQKTHYAWIWHRYYREPSLTLPWARHRWGSWSIGGRETLISLDIGLIEASFKDCFNHIASELMYLNMKHLRSGLCWLLTGQPTKLNSSTRKKRTPLRSSPLIWHFISLLNRNKTPKTHCADRLTHPSVIS